MSTSRSRRLGDTGAPLTPITGAMIPYGGGRGRVPTAIHSSPTFRPVYPYYRPEYPRSDYAPVGRLHHDREPPPHEYIIARVMPSEQRNKGPSTFLPFFAGVLTGIIASAVTVGFLFYRFIKNRPPDHNSGVGGGGGGGGSGGLNRQKLNAAEQALVKGLANNLQMTTNMIGTKQPPAVLAPSTNHTPIGQKQKNVESNDDDSHISFDKEYRRMLMDKAGIIIPNGVSNQQTNMPVCFDKQGHIHAMLTNQRNVLTVSGEHVAMMIHSSPNNKCLVPDALVVAHPQSIILLICEDDSPSLESGALPQQQEDRSNAMWVANYIRAAAHIRQVEDALYKESCNEASPTTKPSFVRSMNFMVANKSQIPANLLTGKCIMDYPAILMYSPADKHAMLLLSFAAPSSLTNRLEMVHYNVHHLKLPHAQWHLSDYDDDEDVGDQDDGLADLLKSNAVHAANQ